MEILPTTQRKSIMEIKSMEHNLQYLIKSMYQKKTFNQRIKNWNSIQQSNLRWDRILNIEFIEIRFTCIIFKLISNGVLESFVASQRKDCRKKRIEKIN